MVASSPNDPYFPSQWGLAKMGFPEAWALVPNGKEVVVAVIDTGSTIPIRTWKAGSGPIPEKSPETAWTTTRTATSTTSGAGI
jgi:hypothetical protein